MHENLVELVFANLDKRLEIRVKRRVKVQGWNLGLGRLKTAEQ